MKITDLYTREAANTGRRVAVPGRNGMDSGEWMHIHHIDADAFRQRRAAVLSRHAMLSDAERNEKRVQHTNELLAALVSGWSLEDECTPDNVQELLNNAPYIADWLDRISSDASVFFGAVSIS